MGPRRAVLATVMVKRFSRLSSQRSLGSGRQPADERRRLITVWVLPSLNVAGRKGQALPALNSGVIAKTGYSACSSFTPNGAGGTVATPTTSFIAIVRLELDIASGEELHLSSPGEDVDRPVPAANQKARDVRWRVHPTSFQFHKKVPDEVGRVELVLERTRSRRAKERLSLARRLLSAASARLIQLGARVRSERRSRERRERSKNAGQVVIEFIESSPAFTGPPENGDLCRRLSSLTMYTFGDNCLTRSKMRSISVFSELFRE